MRRAAGTVIAIVLGLLAIAGPVMAAPPMWLVRDADSEIYLFGTLHALDPGVRWRTPAYDAAYRRAETVWFEADVEGADAQRMGDLMARYGVDPERPLSQKLRPAQVAALRRRVDLARVDHMRPWAAALMLSMQPMLSRGARVDAGADMTMTREARDVAKRVRTFETLEDQIRMFAGLSEGAEVQYLSDVLRGGARPFRLSLHPGDRSMQAAWLAGDLARLGPGLVGDLHDDNPALYEVLLRRRNLAWADTLGRELAGQGVEMVNVGALHMVGPDGLPALLRARGYTVTRVQ